MYDLIKPLEKEFTLPNWMRRIGKWWALLLVYILIILLSLTATYFALLLFLGEITIMGMLLGTIISVVLSPLPLFIFVHSIFELDKMHQKYHLLSTIDPLTNAYNRRYLTEKIDLEIERSNRYQTSFSLLMMDCDNFKLINDNYGHPTGDEFLIHLVNSCKQRIRSTDTIARMGGDEFMILLPETSGEEAKLLANELRQTIPASFDILKECPNLVTLSLGVTTWNISVANSTELISKLDSALYEAKELGKNRVVRYTESLCLKKKFSLN